MARWQAGISDEQWNLLVSPTRNPNPAGRSIGLAPTAADESKSEPPAAEQTPVEIPESFRNPAPSSYQAPPTWKLGGRVEVLGEDVREATIQAGSSTLQAVSKAARTTRSLLTGAWETIRGTTAAPKPNSSPNIKPRTTQSPAERRTVGRREGNAVTLGVSSSAQRVIQQALAVGAPSKGCGAKFKRQSHPGRLVTLASKPPAPLRGCSGFNQKATSSADPEKSPSGTAKGQVHSLCEVPLTVNGMENEEMAGLGAEGAPVGGKGLCRVGEGTDS
mmetsp:Transcript_4957/g.11570  ORF Transcript_4957/g.11570 Transcript_4957/m.11570 type:complete len:275 (-) Transcript_4957:53-877(-)